MKSNSKQGDESGATQHHAATGQPSGSERARDEQREEGGPRYGGEAWKVADERGEDRYGKARNDDANPLELVKPGQQDEDEEGQATAAADVTSGDAQEGASSDQSPASVESGGETAGMGRGEKPRKPKARSK